MKLQLKIQLLRITKPPVWRRVVVPSSFTFSELSLVIQNSFGWIGYHLYLFSPSGWGSRPTIEKPHAEREGLDASKTPLTAFLKKEGQKLIYIYDFGDSWEHKIVVEKIIPESDRKVQILGGKGACPPEDCGGAWGYENLKIVLADKKHPEHKEMKQWLSMRAPGVWDVDAFDKKRAQDIIDNIFHSQS